MPTKTIHLRPTPKFVPPHTRGDAEFDGHGPVVTVTATLSIKNRNQLWVTLSMVATETRRDWTTAAGSQSYMVYDGARDNVQRIIRIITDKFSSSHYTDTNHDDDVFFPGENELVSRFTVTGDTVGDEAGTRTGVIAEFNPVQFEYIEAPPPGPLTEIITINIAPLPKFIPPHVGSGDAEFDGHGPVVQVSTAIEVRNDRELWATVTMDAKETKSDWTEAAGSRSVLIYTHPKKILSIESAASSSASYTDTNHDDDVLQMAGGDLVNQFIVTGDTKGEEAGTRTGVIVTFNPIVLKVQK